MRIDTFMQIGFSTGDLLETDYPLQKALDDFRSIGANAIEFQIGFNHKKFLKEISNLDFSGFESISVHGPKFSKDSKIAPKEVIEAIKEIHKKINLNWVVFHPDEVSDWKIFKNCSFKIAIENNDWRKEFGKNIADLKQIFAGNDIKFVLDVNHCFTNDKTMGLAKSMARNFQDKLCGVHLSGFKTFHEPIYLTKQKEILEAVPENVPIIIESFKSAYENLDEAKKELEYILANIKR